MELFRYFWNSLALQPLQQLDEQKPDKLLIRLPDVDRFRNLPIDRIISCFLAVSSRALLLMLNLSSLSGFFLVTQTASSTPGLLRDNYSIGAWCV